MQINVQLRITADGDFFEKPVEQGIMIKELADEYQSQVPYQILAAKIENRLEELTKTIEEPCRITLLDMREPSCNRIYQRSVSFIYLKAVKDVVDSATVVIGNSLNKGLYTEIRNNPPVTGEDVAEIEKRMREIVEQDIPFEEEAMEREEAAEVLGKENMEDKLRLLKQNSSIQKFKLYSLDGMRNFFYGDMVPSTGYIKHFELRKYRNGVLLRFPEPKSPDRLPEYRDDRLLYQAFGEAKNWGSLMGISYVTDLNEKVESGEYKEIIQISEALHEKKIAYIADRIAHEKKRIILIAGPSSSGKTTFARRLCVQLRVNGVQPLYLGTDDYFVDREHTPRDEKGEHNFEDIDALDLDLFNSNMNDLLAGKEVDLPEYNFIEGRKFFGKRVTKGKKGQVMVIEGIHGLNEHLTEGIQDDEKFKIYISPLTQINIDNHNRISTTDARMLRRIVRDHQFRGSDARSTIKLWPKVRKGEDKNIFPYNGEADVLFNSVHIYEPGVLKKYAKPLLEAVTTEHPEYSEAVRLLKFLEFFKTIEDDHMIVNNSIIREFIGGSIFV